MEQGPLFLLRVEEEEVSVAGMLTTPVSQSSLLFGGPPAWPTWFSCCIKLTICSICCFLVCSSSQTGINSHLKISNPGNAKAKASKSVAKALRVTHASPLPAVSWVGPGRDRGLPCPRGSTRWLQILGLWTTCSLEGSSNAGGFFGGVPCENSSWTLLSSENFNN